MLSCFGPVFIPAPAEGGVCCTMENLSAFLTSLGLQDHLQTFADEGLELQLLPQLVGAGDSGTHADLKELGLSRMGDRLKLIQAVQAMAADERAKTAAHKRDCNEEQGTPARETQEPKRAKLIPMMPLVGQPLLA